jgi:hypothetical protein
MDSSAERYKPPLVKHSLGAGNTARIQRLAGATRADTAASSSSLTRSVGATRVQLAPLKRPIIVSPNVCKGSPEDAADFPVLHAGLSGPGCADLANHHETLRGNSADL